MADEPVEYAQDSKILEEVRVPLTRGARGLKPLLDFSEQLVKALVLMQQYERLARHVDHLERTSHDLHVTIERMEQRVAELRGELRGSGTYAR